MAAIEANPKGWQHDTKFWLQVINLALFMFGLHASSAGKKIASILIDSASTLLATVPAAMQLARVRACQGPDRAERIREDIKALIKALAQAIQQIIMHAQGTKPARSGGAAEGTPASPGPAPDHPARHSGAGRSGARARRRYSSGCPRPG